MNLQNKGVLIKTRRNVLIRRRFNDLNVRSLGTLILNADLVKESKQRMMKNKLRLPRRIQIQIHCY